MNGWSGAKSASSNGIAEVREVAGGTLAVAGVGASVEGLANHLGGVDEPAAERTGSFAVVERGVDQVFIRCSGDAMVLIRSKGGRIRCLRDCQQRRDPRSVETAILFVGAVEQVQRSVLESWLTLGAAPWVVENLVGHETEHALILIEAWTGTEDLGVVGDLADLDVASFLEDGVLEEIVESGAEPRDLSDQAEPTEEEARTLPKGTIPPPGLWSQNPVALTDLDATETVDEVEEHEEASPEPDASPPPAPAAAQTVPPVSPPAAPQVNPPRRALEGLVIGVLGFALISLIAVVVGLVYLART